MHASAGAMAGGYPMPLAAGSADVSTGLPGADIWLQMEGSP